MTSTFLDGLSTLLVTQKPKQAALGDEPYLVELAREFHQYSPWRDTTFDEQAVYGLAVHLIGQGGVFFTDTGFIAGLLVPLHFDPSTIVATEVAWYAPDGGGRELRDAFEDWAREQGATMVQFSALGDEHLDQVHNNFLKNGFHLAELQYVKRL